MTTESTLDTEPCGCPQPAGAQFNEGRTVALVAHCTAVKDARGDAVRSTASTHVTERADAKRFDRQRNGRPRAGQRRRSYPRRRSPSLNSTRRGHTRRQLPRDIEAADIGPTAIDRSPPLSDSTWAMRRNALS
jgi:hypothetical protein